jgi:hypothetical protein
MARFSLGRIIATQAAIQFCSDNGVSIILDIVYRHAFGQWGDVDPESHVANDLAVRMRGAIVSAYRFELGRIVVVTDADRIVTTIMTADECEV